MLELLNYLVAFAIMFVGLFGIIASSNLLKKLISLSIFQTSILLLFISFSKVNGGYIPILKDGVKLYTNPLPHVLMLTAIVVGISTIAVGLAIIKTIKKKYDSIDESELKG